MASAGAISRGSRLMPISVSPPPWRAKDGRLVRASREIEPGRCQFCIAEKVATHGA